MGAKAGIGPSKRALRVLSFTSMPWAWVLPPLYPLPSLHSFVFLPNGQTSRAAGGSLLHEHSPSFSSSPARQGRAELLLQGHCPELLQAVPPHLPLVAPRNTSQARQGRVPSLAARPTCLAQPPYVKPPSSPPSRHAPIAGGALGPPNGRRADVTPGVTNSLIIAISVLIMH
jgi:hypothetical protein